jgi:hypothetical protein
MTWSRWYATKSYLSSALWIVPLVALVLENVLIRLVFALSSWFEWVPGLFNALYNQRTGRVFDATHPANRSRRPRLPIPAR